MNGLQSHDVQCPYCGRVFESLIDCSVPEQSYVEDCEVCCRPIVFAVSVGEDDEISATTSREND